MKVLQKEFTRQSRKRRRLFEELKKKHDSSKQTRLMRFGIVQIKKGMKVSGIVMCFENLSYLLNVKCQKCCHLFKCLLITSAHCKLEKFL